MIHARCAVVLLLTTGLCVIAVGACSGTGAPSSTAQTSGRETQLEAVLSGVAPDGSIGVTTARQLFQLAYGGLSGVALPAGARSAGFDGTIALAGMEAHRTELSVADRAALDAVIGAGTPPSSTVTASAGPLTGAVLTSVLAAAPVCPPLVGYTKPLPAGDKDVLDLTSRVEEWSQKLGVTLDPLGIPIQTVVYKQAGPTSKGVSAEADTWTFDAGCGGGKPAVCRVRFFARTLAETAIDRDNTVAHELWHCFEAVIIGNRDQAFGEAPWLVEGQSEWVGDFESGARDTRWWMSYLRTSGRNLFTRAYDAVGFYASMDSDGAGMFPTLRTMLLDGRSGSVPAFDAAASATGDRLLDTWGSRYFQDSHQGWNYSHPTGSPPATNLAAYIPDATPLKVIDGFGRSFPIEAHTLGLFAVETMTDFVHVQSPEHARSLDDANTETADLRDVWFCSHSDPQRCKCPEGSSGEAPQSTPEEGGLRVAVTAGDAANSITVAGASLDHFCKSQAGNDSAFCKDAKSLHDITQANLDAGLVSRLAQQAQADHLWTGRMATDAPAEISTAMKASAAAYAAADDAERAVGYQVVGGPDVLDAIRTATQAVGAVHAQNQQISQYINAHCGFTFVFA